MIARITLTVALLLVSTSSAKAEEWIVDSRGFGDVYFIQTAVNVASDGDVIIVRPGEYFERLVIEDKGLWLVGQQPDGVVKITGGVTIRNIPAGTQVVLRDIEVQPLGGDFPVLVQSSEGLVQLANCTFRGTSAPVLGAIVRTAAVFEEALRVNLINCEFLATIQNKFSSLPSSLPGDAGLIARGSRIALWGGTVAGARATPNITSSFASGGAGGPGMRLETTTMFVSGAQVVGGAGGDNENPNGSDGGPGGAAFVSGPQSRLFLVDSDLSGGPGGVAQNVGFAMNGAPGMLFEGSGAAYMLNGSAEVHGAPAFALGESDLEMTITGRPGRQVDLYLTTDVPPFLFDRGAAWSLVSASNPAATIGTVPSGGRLDHLQPIPELPASPSTLTATFFCHLNTAGRGSLYGAPIPVVGVNCQTYGEDCDGSGRSDLCEIIDGRADDVDENGRIDSCDDCNGNGVPDFLDIQSGVSLDQNGNGVPDECDPLGLRLYVDQAALPGGDGSIGAPFRTIEEAIDVNLTGDEIILFAGIYTGFENRNLDSLAQSVNLRSLDGPDQCVIDLEEFSNFISTTNGSPSTRTQIRGLGFRYGTSPIFGAVIELGSTASALIQDCTFEPRAPGASHDLIWARRTNVVVSRCELIGPATPNLAGGGQAILMRDTFGGSLTVDQCRFQGLRSVDAGSAIDSVAPEAVITRSSFVDCGAIGFSFATGVIALLDGTALIDQCLFVGSRAMGPGAAVNVRRCEATISSCTFVEGAAPHESAIFIGGDSDARITNSIVFGAGTQIEVTDAASGGMVGITSLHIDTVALETPAVVSGQAMVTTSSILMGDPLFISPAGPDGDPLTFADNDYRLGAGSPFVDAGTNALLAPDLADLDGDGNRTEFVPFDFDGMPRRIDDPAAPDTGQGAAPIVDLGCYERVP